MKLEDIAVIRTGLVTSRKIALSVDNAAYEYKMINLKSVSDNGDLKAALFEAYSSKETLKEEYLTQIGDILIRLSVPYTVLMITERQFTGLVIPSHFSIIRVNCAKAYPEYVFWILSRDIIKKRILQNSSGSSAFGTISSGFFANLEIRMLPMQKQIAIGQFFVLSSKEHQLLTELSTQKSIYNKIIVNYIYTEAKREK